MSNSFHTRELISAPMWRKSACSSSGMFLLSSRQDGMMAKNNEPIARANDRESQTREKIPEEHRRKIHIKDKA